MHQIYEEDNRDIICSRLLYAFFYILDNTYNLRNISCLFLLFVLDPRVLNINITSYSTRLFCHVGITSQ